MEKPMRHVRAGLNVLVICSMLIHLLPTPTAFAASPVVIGEVSWAGSTFSTSDEWIELWNIGDATTSLAGWSLHGAGESGKVIPFATDAVIPPYGTFIVSNYEATDTKSVLATAPNVVTSTVSLSNSALQFTLVDSSDVVIDTAGDGKVPPAGASLPTKMTMIRTLTPDAISPTGWISATTTIGSKPGTTDLGTPGMCDGCHPPPIVIEIVEPVTITDEPVIPDELTTTSTKDAQPIVMDATSSTDETVAATSTDANDPTEIPADSTTTTDVVTDGTTDAIIDPTNANDPIMLENSTTTETTIMSTSTTEQAGRGDASAPTESTTSTTTTSTIALDDTTTAAVSTVTQQTAATITSPPKPAYGMLRLNEIAPYPASGKEWIEITSLDKSQIIPLTNCVLHDGSGKIMTIKNITIDPAISPFAVIQIASSKLNNSGDGVALYDPDGRLIDAMTYGTTKKDEVWIRVPNGNGAWVKTITATPGQENVLTTTTATTTAPTPTVATTSIQTTRQIAGSTTTTTQAGRGSASAPTSLTTTTHLSPTSYATSSKNFAFSVSIAPEIPTSPPTKTTKKTTTTAKPKTASETTKISFDMIDQEQPSGIRVRLQGYVGTPPGLLSKHAFVLQAPDGRGILIEIPRTAKLPDQGATIIVTGSLHFDNQNTPYLKLGAKDQWTKVTGEGGANAPTFRLVDLTAPGSEDAWSLMHVTGTVQVIHGSTVHIDLGDAELDIFIKPLIGYRVKRLTVGDEITVSGILDTTVEPPRLIPRADTEITIIGHKAAAITQSTTQKNPLSDYTPIGAAAGAIATTEGVKRWHRRRRQRQLEQKLATLQSSSV